MTTIKYTYMAWDNRYEPPVLLAVFYRKYALLNWYADAASHIPTVQLTRCRFGPVNAENPLVVIDPREATE